MTEISGGRSWPHLCFLNVHASKALREKDRRKRDSPGKAPKGVYVYSFQYLMIETVAINQLKGRRERLLAQQTEARYGVADSYDRAARAQSGEEKH